MEIVFPRHREINGCQQFRGPALRVSRWIRLLKIEDTELISVPSFAIVPGHQHFVTA